MAYLFLCYPRCSTCKKAQKWLDDNKITYTLRDISADNPSVDELEMWVVRSGLELKRFFNTSGQLYRQLQLKDKLANMSRQEQLALLASDGMLVKRPLLVGDSNVLVGFQPAQWDIIR